MLNFNVELAILTSIIVGLILAFLNIGGIFALAIVGFVAVFLTNDDEANYKIGAMAAGALCLIYFFIGIFTPPDLPYQLPSPVVIGIGYGIEGFFTLILGLIVGLLIYGLWVPLEDTLLINYSNLRTNRNVQKPLKAHENF